MAARLDADAAALTAHTSDTSDAHDASAVSVAAISGLSATDAQAALAELRGQVQTVESSRALAGSAATIQPVIDAMAPGTEYVWLKTDGAGVLLDIEGAVTT